MAVDEVAYLKGEAGWVLSVFINEDIIVGLQLVSRPLTTATARELRMS